MRSLPDMFGFASSQFTSATTGSLTANNAPTSFTLSHDTSFDLKFGDLDPVKLTLHAGTYNDTDSLVTALNSSIDSSTLDNFVHAANVGGKVSFIADTFSSTTLGFGSGSSETSERLPSPRLMRWRRERQATERNLSNSAPTRASRSWSASMRRSRSR